jgi:Glycosyltransferase family 9 (heptosyltransferase)
MLKARQNAGISEAFRAQAHQDNDMCCVTSNDIMRCPVAVKTSKSNIEFYSLQKGQPGESELAELKRSSWSGADVLDFTSQLNDFSDTAALLDNLDLVLTVDTSTAHLAEALGKPVWILNRFDTCWRWLLDRTDRRLVARRYLNRAGNGGLGFKRWFA